MTKEQLKEYKDTKKELDDLKQRREEVEASLYGVRSKQLDGMPKRGTNENDLKEKQIDAKEKLLMLYKAKEKKLCEILVVIESAIEKLDPRERQLIRMHYIDGMTWEQVCVKMCYSWRQVHRIHSKALQKLKE